MSRRECVYVSRRVSCDGGASPNAYFPAITVEVRMHWPPNTVQTVEVAGVLQAAVNEALEELWEKHATRAAVLEEMRRK